MNDISKNWSNMFLIILRDNWKWSTKRKGKISIFLGQCVSAKLLNAKTPSSSVAVDDEILVDKVLEEAEAEEQEVETCSNKDSGNITFVADDYMLVLVIKQNITWAELLILLTIIYSLLIFWEARFHLNIKSTSFSIVNVEDVIMKMKTPTDLRWNRFKFSKLPDVIL